MILISDNGGTPKPFFNFAQQAIDKAIKDFFHTLAAPNSIAIASAIARQMPHFVALNKAKISIVADKKRLKHNAAGLCISQARMLAPHCRV